MTSSGSSLSTECAQEPPDQAGTTPQNPKDDSDFPSGAIGSDKTAKAWSPKRGPKFNGQYHGVMGGYNEFIERKSQETYVQAQLGRFAQN